MLINKINIQNDILKNNLVFKGQCPVCGSSERKSSEISSDNQLGNEYLKTLSEYLKIDLYQMLKTMMTYRCLNCSSEYCDPWISPDISNLLYSQMYGRHRDGWLKYIDWVKNNFQNEEKFSEKLTIFKIIKNFLGTIDTYAELNCPFQGLFPYFSSLKFKKSENYTGDIFKNFEKMKQIFNSSLSGFSPMQIEDPILDDYPNKNFLILEPSSMFWGDNCSSQNLSCYNVATSIFNVKKLYLNDLESNKLKLDVFASYSNIDHVMNPMKTIEKMTNSSKIVILTLHHLNSKISKQHLFKYGIDFAKFLKRSGYYTFQIAEKELKNNINDIDNPLSTTTLLISKEINFN